MSTSGEKSGCDTPITYSVVVPVYTNEETLAPLLAALLDVSRRLSGPMEAVFVSDGSPDGSLELLRQLLPTAGIPTQLLVHSRNFGSFAAIRTGLAAARGQYVGVMAADLQEPPELVEQFLAILRTGAADVCVGRRESRADPMLTSILSRTFWWLYRRVINPQIPRGGVDVFGCTAEVARRLLDLSESHSSLVGLLFWVGYRRVEVPYARRERHAGRSGWTIRKRVRYLMDSVYSFTDVPIQVLSAVGVVGAGFTLIVGALVFGFWAAGVIREPGYTPLMLTMLFSTFVLLAGLGVVGSYVWRTYENSKGRPHAIAMTHTTYEG